jgi:hypothetical protein
MRTPTLLSYTNGKERLNETSIEKCTLLLHLKKGVGNFFILTGNGDFQDIYRIFNAFGK